MKLYELKRGDKIVLKGEEDGVSPVTFDHIDGMYSFCKTADGRVVHLSAVTPLAKVGDHYELDEEEK